MSKKTKKITALIGNTPLLNLGKFFLTVIGLVILSFGNICAQEHERHTHKHLRNEIGFSGGALYAIGHKEWGGGVHLHYFRTLKPHSKLSLGGGIEQAWVDGSHFNIAAGAKYQIFDRLSISALPGASFITHKETATHDTHEQKKTLFTIHFELVYDIFHWDKIHLGTVLHYSWKAKDQHAMIGVHIAYCF